MQTIELLIKSKINKAKKLESKGDALLGKKKYHEAASTYLQAIECEPSRVDLYTKLLTTHEKYSDQWNEEDFAFNLELTMKKQELEQPIYKYINARATPEFKAVSAVVSKMFSAPTQEQEIKLIEEILNHNNMATYALIDALLRFKHLATKKNG